MSDAMVLAIGHLRPSMGPRLRSRGMQDSAALAGLLAELLQWGRGLGAAECCALGIGSVDRSDPLGLQWGRGLGAAE